jgi:malic enzyme
MGPFVSRKLAKANNKIKKANKVKKDVNEMALEYHAQGWPGKIKVSSTKPCNTAADFSLAYVPGVAAPCLEIEKTPKDAYKYLAKEKVQTGIIEAGNEKKFSFGPAYLLPKPLDHRVLTWVAPAVAEAAMKCGRGQKPIADLIKYTKDLGKRVLKPKKWAFCV